MGYLEVECGCCGKRWRVSESSGFHERAARTCPKCGEQVDEQTWERQVVPALGCMADANRELHKDATGYGKTRFMVGYVYEH